MQRTGRAIYAIILSPGQKSRTDSGNGGIYDCSTSISVLRHRRVHRAYIRWRCFTAILAGRSGGVS